uniref:Dual specificity phosphatase catalytic domain n=1 Tax=viral metagenome TaxID=1070528 RepID=A0A6C0JRA2_9ZZZZ
MEESVSQIIDGLWLSGEGGAQSREFFEKENIKGVVNCTPSTLNAYAAHGIEYLRIPVNDSTDKEDLELMDEYIDLAVEWLRVHHKLQGLNVLVHCAQGIQRSATVVCCYLQKHWGLKFKEAVEFMIIRRQAVFYNGDKMTFRSLLENYVK